MTAYTLPHLTDGDLVRHLDAEGDPPERARRETHLEACADCGSRVELLGRQSDAVHGWLLRADASRSPARAASPSRAVRPSRTAATPWLRAAAIVLLVAAPLAAFPPVRDWVATRVGLGSDPVTPTATPAAQVAPVIRFVPAAGTFTVRIDGPPSAGALAIARAAGPEAELRGAGGDGAAAPVVSEDGLRISASGAATRYELRVPSATTDVVIRLDGGTVRVAGAAIDRGQVVDFGGG